MGQLWVEPHDVAAAFQLRWLQLSTRLVLFAPGTVQKYVTKISSTTGHQAVYEVVVDRGKLLTMLRGHIVSHQVPVLIDNGTYSFAVAGVRCSADGNVEYRILDPHYGMLYPSGCKVSAGEYATGSGEDVYGDDSGKDSWQPQAWLEEDFGRPLGGSEWMMLFVAQVSTDDITLESSSVDATSTSKQIKCSHETDE